MGGRVSPAGVNKYCESLSLALFCKGSVEEVLLGRLSPLLRALEDEEARRKGDCKSSSESELLPSASGRCWCCCDLIFRLYLGFFIREKQGERKNKHTHLCRFLSFHAKLPIQFQEKHAAFPLPSFPRSQNRKPRECFRRIAALH